MIILLLVNLNSTSFSCNNNDIILVMGYTVYRKFLAEENLGEFGESLVVAQILLSKL